MTSSDFRQSSAVLPHDSMMQQFRANPPGKLFCLYGDSLVFRLSLHATAHAVLNGSTITVVDGTNRFDAYFIAEFARRVSAKPEDLLQRIFIARAFTCYQMESTITDRLPEVFSLTPSRIFMMLT